MTYTGKYAAILGRKAAIAADYINRITRIPETLTADERAALMAARKDLGVDETQRIIREMTLTLAPTACQCCDRPDCIHRDCYRRFPRSEGGLDLCYNLNRDPNPRLT